MDDLCDLVEYKGLPSVLVSGFSCQRSKLNWGTHFCWAYNKLGAKGEGKEGARGQPSMGKTGKLKSTVGQHGHPGEQQ